MPLLRASDDWGPMRQAGVQQPLQRVAQLQPVECTSQQGQLAGHLFLLPRSLPLGAMNGWSSSSSLSLQLSCEAGRLAAAAAAVCCLAAAPAFLPPAGLAAALAAGFAAGLACCACCAPCCGSSLAALALFSFAFSSALLNMRAMALPPPAAPPFLPGLAEGFLPPPAAAPPDALLGGTGDLSSALLAAALSAAALPDPAAAAPEPLPPAAAGAAVVGRAGGRAASAGSYRTPPHCGRGA